MKRATSSKRFPASSTELRAAIRRAPAAVKDAESPYDPNDAAAVKAFWSKGVVRQPGQRGPGRKPKKVLLSVRYSPEVVEYFKSTGEGWQARMDEVLKKWVSRHRTA